MKMVNQKILAAFYRYPGWMTEQLLGLGKLAVDVQAEDDRHCLTDEQAGLLTAPVGSSARRRCVYLLVNEPLIYAETIIPEVTLQTVPGLKQLSSKPLGSLLKAEGAERGGIFFAMCHENDVLFQAAMTGVEASVNELLLRYSVFTFPERQKILVYEVFLPAVDKII